MLNPFIICDVQQQAIYRAYADREAWLISCLASGGEDSALRAFDQQAHAYARTTIYPNEDVVAYLRKLVLDALLRGEILPGSPQEAIERDHRRYMQGLAERLEGLPEKFKGLS